jgi:hypothetical protein
VLDNRNRGAVLTLCVVVLVGASLMTVACGGEPPTNPTAQCGGGGGLSGPGAGPVVFGFTLDRATLTNDGLGVTLRVGARTQVGITVDALRSLIIVGRFQPSRT